MDIELYDYIVKRSYNIGRSFSQVSKAERIIRKLLENLEEGSDLEQKLEEVHEILGFVLDKLEY